jgi:hypothetical protein
MFRDTAPHHRMPEPSAAECAQDDERYWQECAAQRGGECLDLAQHLMDLFDKRPSDWRADDMQLLHRIHAKLTEARDLARCIGAEFGAGIATASTEE